MSSQTGRGQRFAIDASRSNMGVEVGAMRKMFDRTEERFGVKPEWIAADTAYGSSDNLPSSQSSTRGTGTREPSRDPTKHGMMRMAATLVRVARRCGTPGRLIRPLFARNPEVRIPGHGRGKVWNTLSG